MAHNPRQQGELSTEPRLTAGACPQARLAERWKPEKMADARPAVVAGQGHLRYEKMLYEKAIWKIPVDMAAVPEDNLHGTH
jgi:hypothetical protein